MILLMLHKIFRRYIQMKVVFFLISFFNRDLCSTGNEIVYCVVSFSRFLAVEDSYFGGFFCLFTFSTDLSLRNPGNVER
jgi:hypothetical protein